MRDTFACCADPMLVGDLGVLPDVLVEKIVLLLDLEALLAAAKTCKGFGSLLMGRLDEAKTKASKLFSRPFTLSKRDVLRRTWLDLSSRLLSAKGAAVLAQALLVGALPMLKQLWLDDNQIGDEGCKALAEHLPTSLEMLWLSENQIGDEGCMALAEHLPTSLKELWLGDNQIGDEGCKALAEHLPTCTSLKELWLDRNQIGDEGCKALAEHLPTSLKWLYMGLEHPQLRAACVERGITLH